MTGARDCVLTVQFHTKVKESNVKDILADAKKDQFSNPQKLKALSKEILAGKETEMQCFLTKSEGTLGRSTVIDLNAPWGMNFRQIDHRTIDYVILKNVKYTAK